VVLVDEVFERAADPVLRTPSGDLLESGIQRRDAVIGGQTENGVAGRLDETSIALFRPALRLLGGDRLLVEFIELKDVLLRLLVLVDVIAVEPVQQDVYRDREKKNVDVALLVEQRDQSRNGRGPEEVQEVEPDRVFPHSEERLPAPERDARGES